MDSILEQKSFQFAIRIVNLCKHLQSTKKEYTLSKQLLRSGTSIGANVAEAQQAQSKADFISKLQIALKECYESEYWLELFTRANIVSVEQTNVLLHDCGEIRRMLISSLTTIKKNSKQ